MSQLDLCTGQQAGSESRNTGNERAHHSPVDRAFHPVWNFTNGTSMRISASVGRLALGLTAVAALTTATGFEAVAAVELSPEAAASALAEKSGKTVAVPSLTDETSTTVANPDGSFTASITSGPSNVELADGTWKAVDTTLETHGSVLKPRVSRVNIEVSAGGDGPLAKLVDDSGRVFAPRWPSPLSEPSVQGNVATFTDAAGQGADLVVTVLPTGFRYDVVLRDKPAGPLELRIPVDTQGVDLQATPDGGLQLKSADGGVVAAAAQPLAYDSSGRGKARGGAVSKIASAVETQDGVKVLVLKPDTSFLADPARVYPVTLAPAITLPGVVTDTDVATSWASHPGDVMIIAGTMPWENGQGDDVMRSLIKFDTQKINGKRVILAGLGMWNLETNACGAEVGSGLTAERITSPWDETNLNWGNKPSTTHQGASTNRAGRGRTWTEPCAAGAGFLAWPVTDIAKAWAGGAPNHGIQLRGADENEKTNWRAFAASENKNEGVHPPTLTVAYWR
ncbi:DNRLRE domain-containing protein [Nonomuraea zeae]|uniref:DNRLRE domain-containing protein n=1 Tax=Nonomuraea zeae TaxID=1642303 RepID=A0A5S4GW25_9ACTN|nr:DNRLRE domain-containing protein [Nonomuraea zeae]TMR36932.1 DNRLRE domain-containing protein [Nonomuraea zeae]